MVISHRVFPKSSRSFIAWVLSVCFGLSVSYIGYTLIMGPLIFSTPLLDPLLGLVSALSFLKIREQVYKYFDKKTGEEIGQSVGSSLEKAFEYIDKYPHYASFVFTNVPVYYNYVDSRFQKGMQQLLHNMEITPHYSTSPVTGQLESNHKGVTFTPEQNTYLSSILFFEVDSIKTDTDIFGKGKYVGRDCCINAFLALLVDLYFQTPMFIDIFNTSYIKSFREGEYSAEYSDEHFHDWVSENLLFTARLRRYAKDFWQECPTTEHLFNALLEKVASEIHPLHTSLAKMKLRSHFIGFCFYCETYLNQTYSFKPELPPHE